MAGLLMLGVVTASLASWLLDRVSEVEEESRLATRRGIRALRDQVADLKKELPDSIQVLSLVDARVSMLTMPV
jgi:voltage-gated potassium channel